ncbi:FHA domain-containing protein [bacterium]|nr:FHA domain-containing protein [bacterium]
MNQHDSTTEQYGFGDLNAPWLTGVELCLWEGSQFLGQRELDRPQLGLGGPGSDWVVSPELGKNLWKIVYRSGRTYFVGSDKSYPAYRKNSDSSTLYTELTHQDELQLGSYRLQVTTQAASAAYLEGFTSPHLSTRWALPNGTTTLGRVGAGICLEDATVSRVHASIRSTAGQFWLQAHSQRSESRLNGNRLEVGAEVELRDGDLLNLGRQVLRFHLTSLRGEADAGLRLACLGPLRAWLADQPLKNEIWQGVQVQHTLIFLCLQRRHACPEERLIDQLWPGEEVSKKRLSNIISHLRAVLRPLHGEPILREEGGLRVNPGLSVWLDLEEVQDLLGRPATLAHSQKLLELYQGPFLPSCNSPWAEVLRSQMESQLVAYLTGLAQQQPGEAALSLAQQAIAIDPLAQSAYLVAIDWLRRSGRARESKRYAELAKSQLEKARVPILPELDAVLRHPS